MIPLKSENEYLKKELDGVTYYLRYLTGEFTDQYIDLTESTRSETAKHAKAAKKNVLKELGITKVSDEELAELINNETIRIAGEDIDNNHKKNIDFSKGIIDLFVCGWKIGSGDEELYIKKPSNRIPMKLLTKLSLLITDNMEELTEPSVDESKN